MIQKATSTSHPKSTQKSRLISASLLFFWLLFGNGMLFASYCNYYIGETKEALPHTHNTFSSSDEQPLPMHATHFVCEPADEAEVDEENTDEHDDHVSLFNVMQVYLAWLNKDQQSYGDTWSADGFGRCMGALYMLHHSWKSFLLS